MTPIIVAIVASVPVILTGVLGWLQSRNPYVELERAAELREHLPGNLQQDWDAHLRRLVHRHTLETERLKRLTEQRRQLTFGSVGIIYVFGTIFVAVYMSVAVEGGQSFVESLPLTVGFAVVVIIVMLVYIIWGRKLRNEITAIEEALEAKESGGQSS